MKIRKKDKINVLITGLGGGGHGMQILKALKLATFRYHITGTDITKVSYGLPFIDNFYILPRADQSDYIQCLVDVCKRNNIRVLFHGSEPELRIIAENRSIFERMGIFLPINSNEVIQRCMNKYSIMNYLQDKGFNVPATHLISSINEISSVAAYPVVCKPHIGGGGSNNVFIAQDTRELKLIAEYLLLYLKGFIVQEYIGKPDSEFTVGVLADPQKNIIGSIGVKRYILSALSNRLKIVNRTGRKELGKILAISSGVSQGEIGVFKDITEYCEKAAVAVGATGPINFQCRVAEEKVYIFEVNPRFSGTTSLRAMVGFNEPDILIRKCVRGEKIDKISYTESVILRGLDEKLIHAHDKNK